MVVSKQIIVLVERFKEYDYYSEEYTKRNFILPLLEALGWNTSDTREDIKPPYLTEVISDKWPRKGKKNKTYLFKIRGKKKSTIKRKKPRRKPKSSLKSKQQAPINVNIEGLPIYIKTNFRQLEIYDSKFKPQEDDNPNPIKSYFYTEYIDKWDEIQDYFSRTAVINENHLKLLPGNNESLRSLVLIDNFLKEVRSWRNDLTMSIVPKNKKLNYHEVNYSIERMIYYLVFFRFLEDKNVLVKIHLMNLLEQEGAFSNFLKKCKRIDATHNLGFNLNNNSKSSLIENQMFYNLTIDDEVFKEMIIRSYGYDFNKLPVDIMGKIYEEFLNEEITFKSSRRIKFKKNLGKNRTTYYTDPEVTGKINEETIGKQIKAKTPKEISKIRILDPRCHQGNLLIEAYKYLLEYHLNYYKDNGITDKDVLFKYEDDYILTLKEKTRILSNNIYGVDEDMKATEVAKLSLLLTALDTPITDPKKRRQYYVNTGRLPDLSKNIKYGDILLDLDIYDYMDYSLYDRVHPINCDDEFNRILCNLRGEFNILISNISNERIENLPEGYSKYLDKTYKYYNPQVDANTCLYEKGLNLLKKHGRLCYLSQKDDIEAVYEQLHENKLAGNAFHEFDMVKIEDLEDSPELGLITLKKKFETIHKRRHEHHEDKQEHIIIDDTILHDIINKIQQKKSLESLNKFINQNGIPIGEKKVYVIDDKIRDKLMREDSRSAEIIKPLLIYSKGFNKKAISKKYLINPQYDINVQKKYPAIYKYLFQYKTELLKRKKYYQGVHWYNFAEYPFDVLEKPKIIYPGIKKEFESYFDYDGKYQIGKSAYFVYSVNDDYFDIKVLNLIISSNLMKFYVTSVAEKQRRDNRFNFYKVVDTLPLIEINKNDPRICRLNDIADDLLEENKKLEKLEEDYYDAKLLDKKVDIKNRILYIQGKISRINKEINRIIYELYDITDEEVGVIEEILEFKD